MRKVIDDRIRSMRSEVMKSLSSVAIGVDICWCLCLYLFVAVAVCICWCLCLYFFLFVAVVVCIGSCVFWCECYIHF